MIGNGTNGPRYGRAQDTPITGYDNFVARTGAVFGRMTTARKTTAEKVAEVVYQATTDRGERLRYFAGEDVGDFVKAKRDMSDQDYVAFMRNFFRGED